MQPYLKYTFLARGDGFHFSSRPPPNIHAREHLRSRDIEEVLACILASLQRGAFDVLDDLVRLLSVSQEHPLWNAATALFGHAAPEPSIRWFVARYGDVGGEFVRHAALDVAASAGRLWVVPLLLRAHASFEDDDARRFCRHSLSWLLEDGRGEIAAGPDLLPVDGDPSPVGEPEVALDLAGYDARVLARVEQIRGEHADAADIAIVEGEPLNLERVATRLLACIEAGGPGSRIENGRMLLEATTGIDCRDFYDSNGLLRPLSAAAVVEDFLSSGKAARYTPGVRYFFGHRIPRDLARPAAS